MNSVRGEQHGGVLLVPHGKLLLVHVSSPLTGRKGKKRRCPSKGEHKDRGNLDLEGR